MPELYLNDELYRYSLQRQRRKSLQMALIAPYELALKIPQQLTLTELETFLQQQKNWIQAKNLALIATAAKPAPPDELGDGSRLPFMGTDYKLQVTKSCRKPAIKIQGTTLLVNLYLLQPVSLAMVLRAWYLRQAKHYLTARTGYWCEKMGATVSKIAIKEQKTRWGSCSSLGNINYNWRIILAPPPIIDYLVIHEVAHRRHLNHSPLFWQLVKQHCPAYVQHRDWLKNNGKHLFSILTKE